MSSLDNSILRTRRNRVVLVLCFTAVFLLLALMRSSEKDDALYLQETQLMSQCLKEGRWFGGEPVGVHGFLFKLPAALIFTVTGPSVFWATLINILFAGIALWLFYLLMTEIWDERRWAWFGCYLLLFSYHFLRLTPTFLREIPALLMFILFVYLVVTARGWLALGLVLMLLLDAKESVFVMVVPGYIIWLLAGIRRQKGGGGVGRHILGSAVRIGAVLIPTVIFLFLMFFTNVVPLNPKVAFMLGLNEGGLRTFIHKNVTPRRAGMNVQKGGREIFKLGSTPYGWKAAYNGLVELAPEWVGEEKWPAVRLEKPAVRSQAPGGIFHHWARMWPEAKRFERGEVIRYSLWYKTTCRSANTITFTNRIEESRKWVGGRDVRLVPDGKWHFIEVPVPVEESGRILSFMGWRSGNGTVLFVAGCRAERGSPIADAPAIGAGEAADTHGSPDHAGRKHHRIGVFERSKRWLLSTVNLTLSYVGKIFYPATFSLAGVPRFLIFLSLLMSFPLFKRWRREGRTELLALPVMFWISIFAYVFRWSLGRYLMPFLPLIIVFFIFFLKEGIHWRRFARNGIAAAMVFASLGLVFETRYVWVKLVLNALIFAALWIVFLSERSDTGRFNRGVAGFVVLTAFTTGVVALATSILLPGQIGRWWSHGANSQYEVIADHVQDGDKVWINANAHLFRFFREEPFLSFTRGKYHFNLMPWVPKARLINRSRQPWTHHFRWGDEKELKEKLTVEGTSRMVMVVSNKKSEKYRFPMQHRKKDLDRAPFLKLENTLALKNKTVYFYKVL